MKIKGDNNIMYTFTIVVHIANVYIIFLPLFMTEMETGKLVDTKSVFGSYALLFLLH